MGVPATTGVLRTKIADMQIGDYIACSYQAGLTFVIGVNGLTEFPLTGVANGSANNYFYFIKVDKGLLMSDRVAVHTVTWDTLNTNKLIQGTPKTIDSIVGSLRSLTGGVAYVDANGNSSTTDLGFGAFPTNNEWDKYIVKFPADKIQSGKTVDDVFHYTNSGTWTQDTPNLALAPSTQRVRTSTTGKIAFALSSTTSGAYGFRPVFEYQEA